jgi:phage-related protein
VITVEFYRDPKGGEPVLEYFEQVRSSGEAGRVAALLRHIELMEAGGYPVPGDKPIDRESRVRIWEARIGPHRVAYAQLDEVIWLLHAWRKRSQKLDQRAAGTARRRLRDIATK